MFTKKSFAVLFLAFLVVITGCSGKPANQANSVEDEIEELSVSVPDTDSSDPETEAAKSGSVDSSRADQETPTGDVLTDSLDPVSVTLGDPALTAGIPGDGALTAEAVRGWLDSDENHAPLTVKLPLGLSAGVASVTIPADNQLTRAKIELGRQLYFDKRLSSDNTVSCADCHHPDEGYGRHTRFGVGVDKQEGGRNSPVSYNRILSGAQFWDGRAASLEEQAVGPIANPIEMANTHEAAVETVKGIEAYSLQFDKVFADGVTIGNIGKAIASFERAIVTGPSAFDYYEPLRQMETQLADDLEDLEVLKEDEPDLYEDYMAVRKASEAHPISESAKRGRALFFSQRVNCTACHVGANLTDEKYHNLGVGMDKDPPDLGRYEVTKDDKDRGAFKTPTIRNVALSGPYMHDGSQETLDEVVEWYNKGGHPNDYLSKDVKKLDLTAQEKKDLVSFMEACTGKFPQVETGRLPE
jgi:cytochrome c peroxidase